MPKATQTYDVDQIKSKVVGTYSVAEHGSLTMCILAMTTPAESELHNAFFTTTTGNSSS